MERDTAETGSGLGVAGLTLVAAVLVLVPLLAVAVPPLHDYPFHLARADALAALLGQVDHATPYQLGSFLLPNVAMDVVMLGLTSVLRPMIAGRVFLGLELLLLLGGAMALHRALHGRASPWPLLAALFLYNWVFLFGFTNYLFGVGVMLWGVAAWVAMSGSGWPARLGVALVFSIVLLLSHLVAFGLFGVMLAGLALHDTWLHRREGWPAFIRLVLPTLPLMTALLLFVALSPTAGEARQPIQSHGWIGWKPLMVRRALLSSEPWLDWLTLAPVAGMALALVVARRIRMAGAMTLPLVLLVVTFMLMPFGLFGSLFADMRLPLVILLAAIAATDVRRVPSRAAMLVAALLLALLAVRSGAIARSWIAEMPVFARHEAAFALVPPGSVLWAATAAPYPSFFYGSDAELALWHPPLKHVVSLASVGRDVFVPATFADPFKQPIAVPAALAAAKTLQFDNPFKTPTAAALAERADAIRALRASGHIGWGAADQDYLLLSYPDRMQGALPPGLAVVVRDPLFLLLRLE